MISFSQILISGLLLISVMGFFFVGCGEVGDAGRWGCREVRGEGRWGFREVRDAGRWGCREVGSER